MKPKLTPEQLDKVASIISDTLEERFGDEFVFDPIVVIPEVDDYGEDIFPYLDIYIVFDGDQTKLDPRWTGGHLIGLLMERMEEEIGIDEFPSPSFVAKSGWKRMERKLKRKISRASY